MRFVDTNVLLYAVSPLPEEADKRHRARELLEQPDLVISVQVLQEFYHQAIRPTGSAQLTLEDALDFLEPILELPVQPLTADLFLDAVAISRRFQLSYWDGAILAAARALGCNAVYSEDSSTPAGLRWPARDKPLPGRCGSHMTTDATEHGLAD